MPISYAEACSILERIGQEACQDLRCRKERITLEFAQGRYLCEDVVSPQSTPPFDTSAMDGIAVNSNVMLKASDCNPIKFYVRGTMAAGDEPVMVSMEPDEDGVYPCIEIMTGAQFPMSSLEAQFDACVPIEYVEGVRGPNRQSKYVHVHRPAVKNQHRRFAGCDFKKGQVIAEAGTKVGPHHVMAMASVGISQVTVLPKIRVGIWSTGKELVTGLGQDHSCKINDANGPFLIASLQHPYVESCFLGVLDDARDTLVSEMLRVVEQGNFDILITTGAVSAGKFDYIRDAIEDIGATIHFHKVAIRPGHPVLFAEFVDKSEWSCIVRARRTAFFGLPGNPIAAAACWRMIGGAYLQHSLGTVEPVIFASVFIQDNQMKDCSNLCSKLPATIRAPSHLDVFRHGFLSFLGHELQVKINSNQSSSQIQPFVQANCWVHIPQGHGDIKQGDIVRCYSLVADQPLL